VDPTKSDHVGVNFTPSDYQAFSHVNPTLSDLIRPSGGRKEIKRVQNTHLFISFWDNTLYTLGVFSVNKW
jgi:hypothetical protein